MSITRSAPNTLQLEQDDSRRSSTVLLCESQSSNFATPRKISDLVAIDLLSSPSLLVDDPRNEAPRFVAVDAATGGVRDEGPRITQANLNGCDSHLLFDVSHSALGERALLVTPPGTAVRLNGLPAPVITPLELGDQLSFEPGRVFYITRRRQSAAIATPSALVGAQCALCLTAFSAETRVVLCGTCGAARHLEGVEVFDEADRLVCATFGSCPVCETPSPLNPSSYAFAPDGYEDTEASS